MQLQYTYKAPTACQSPPGKAVYANLTAALKGSLQVVPGVLRAQLAEEESPCESRPEEADQEPTANYEVCRVVLWCWDEWHCYANGCLSRALGLFPKQMAGCPINV